jgi:hypothetical protein
MTRKSAAAIAAAGFRAGGLHPTPPAELPPRAAQIWRGIVEARPVDFFAPGSLELLATFCRVSAVQETLLAQLEAEPSDDDRVARVAKLAATLTTLGTKLRLTIQSASRIGEAATKAKEAPGKASRLLGGHAVELRGMN